MKITPIHHHKLSKVFEKAGWKFIRQQGDHLIYGKAKFIRPVVIPRYKNIPIFIIKNNLRTAKISREEYLRFLKEI